MCHGKCSSGDKATAISDAWQKKLGKSVLPWKNSAKNNIYILFMAII